MHNLGSTGVQVSEYCLGAMMFGAVGQPRPRRVRPDHPPRARRRHQLHRHRRRLLGGRVGGDRRQGARRAGATRSCSRPRSHAPMGERPQHARQLAPLDHAARSRTACAGSAPTTSTSTRSTGPTRRADVDETLGALTDLVHQGKVRVIGSLDVPGRADRRGAVGRRAARPRAVPVRAAAVLDPRPRHRARRCCRRASGTAWA